MVSPYIHNWSRLTSSGLGVSWGWPWSRTPEKGHPQALQKFIAASEGKSPAPISLENIIEVSRAAIHMQNLTEGSNINL
jgi:carbonic anhydrase